MSSWFYEENKVESQEQQKMPEWLIDLLTTYELLWGEPPQPYPQYNPKTNSWSLPEQLIHTAK